jgi:hypothetical protein
MFKWFDAKDVDKFSDWLVAELLKRYPPAGVDVDVKKATQRLRKVHDSLFLRVEEFAQNNLLNIYQRARLGNRIKWALREAGYPENFGETFTHEVVTVVTLRNSQAKNAAKKS